MPTLIVDAALGAIIATYFWVRGIISVARPSIKPPRNLVVDALPVSLSRAARDHLAVNIYWYSRVGVAAALATVYPYIYVSVIIGELNITVPISKNPAPAIPPSTYFIGLFIIAIALAPAVIPVRAVSQIIERRMVYARVSEDLCSLLEAAETQVGQDDAYPGFMVDPLGDYRRDLASIADSLSDAAKQLDARQKRGFSPHPISTLLRAVSRHTQKFLMNERSLASDIPSDLIDTLAITLTLLSARRDPVIYGLLARRVSAFDGDGGPAVELIEKPPGRFAIVVTRALTGIPRMAVVSTSIATMAALAIIAILAVRHKINVSDLLQYLK